MAERVESLLKAAQPMGRYLTKICGTYTAALSAGIVALYEADAEWRQYYMAKAAGEEPLELPAKKKELERMLLRQEIVAVLDELGFRPTKTAASRQAKSAKSVG